MQRLLTMLVLGSHISARRHQRLHCRRRRRCIAVLNGPVQRLSAILVLGPHISARLCQSGDDTPHRRCVSVLCRQAQRSAALLILLIHIVARCQAGVNGPQGGIAPLLQHRLVQRGLQKGGGGTGAAGQGCKGGQRWWDLNLIHLPPPSLFPFAVYACRLRLTSTPDNTLN